MTIGSSRLCGLFGCSLLLAALALSMPAPASAQLSGEALVREWKKGLGGSRLTSYTGSVVNSNSSLRTVEFCRDGRYRYKADGSWSTPNYREPRREVDGWATGAFVQDISGTWDIAELNGATFLTYVTDDGEEGVFRIWLESNTQVNIGGTTFTVEQGVLGC